MPDAAWSLDAGRGGRGGAQPGWSVTACRILAVAEPRLATGHPHG